MVYPKKPNNHKMKNTTYKQTDINPLKTKNSGDCVINALGIALNKDWDSVFNDLVEIAREKKAMLNSNVVIWEYLKNYKCLPVKYETEQGKKRYKVKHLTNPYFFSNGYNYIVSVANHLTAVKKGVIMDKWNTSEKSAYKIWRIPNNE